MWNDPMIKINVITTMTYPLFKSYSHSFYWTRWRKRGERNSENYYNIAHPNMFRMNIQMTLTCPKAKTTKFGLFRESRICLFKAQSRIKCIPLIPFPCVWDNNDLSSLSPNFGFISSKSSEISLHLRHLFYEIPTRKGGTFRISNHKKKES